MLEEAHRIARLGSWSYDPERDTIWWSKSLYDLFELEPGSDIGRFEIHLERTYVPESADRLAEAVERALREGVPYVVELETRHGPQYILARGEPRCDETGRVRELEGTVLDVTQLKMQEKALAEANARLERAVEDATEELRLTVEELASANRELEGFVHMASHDLQEPLRALRTYSQLLEEDLGPSVFGDAADDLRFIREASQRMQRMLDALLDLSDASRAELVPVWVSVDQLVDGILEDFRPSLRDSRAEVERCALPEVLGDFGLLERAYSNLISNALKFGGDPPRVAFTAEARADAWVLGVEDSGPGIDPAYVERAFLPFKRLGQDRGRPGSGMGLAICKRVVERHGGTIWIERGRLGGAHVRFSLPRRPAP